VSWLLHGQFSRVVGLSPVEQPSAVSGWRDLLGNALGLCACESSGTTFLTLFYLGLVISLPNYLVLAVGPAFGCVGWPCSRVS